MQSIYNWFQGKALPSLDNFYALSSYLGTELDSLIKCRRDVIRSMRYWKTPPFQTAGSLFWFLLEAEVQSSS